MLQEWIEMYWADDPDIDVLSISLAELDAVNRLMGNPPSFQLRQPQRGR